jgi:hypothetical protein
MAFIRSVTFRNKTFSCEFFVDSSASPCFIFVLLKDENLIKEFEEDITIKTDGDSRLSQNDDYPELAALRQVLFDHIKTTPAFLSAKSATSLSKQAQSKQ